MRFEVFGKPDCAMCKSTKDKLAHLLAKGQQVTSLDIADFPHKDVVDKVKIVKGEIDIKQSARDQLAKRGLSQGGREVDFSRAKEEAGMLVWDEHLHRFVSIPKD